jgi:hypothetical protein
VSDKTSSLAFSVASLWSIVKLSPIFLLFAYAAGYVVNMSYLSTLGFHYARLVNTTFLKTGVLVVTLFGVIAYTVYSNFPNPTDNIAKSYKSLPHILNISLIFAVLISYYTTLTSNNEFNAILKAHPASWGLMPLLIASVFANFWATSYAARSASTLKRALWLVIPALLLVGLSLYVGPAPARTFLLLLSLTVVLTHVYLGVYGDRKMAVVAPLLASLSFLVACSYFGKYVYSHVSQTIGGTRPYVATLVLRPGYIDAARAVDPSVSDAGLVPDVLVLYEDSDMYIIQGPYDNLQVAKDAFVASMTKR